MVKMGLCLCGAGPGSGGKRRRHVKIFRPARLRVCYGRRRKFGNGVRALMMFGLPIAMKLIDKYP